MEWMKEWCLMDMTHLYLGKYKALKVAYHPYISINFHPSIHPSIHKRLHADHSYKLYMHLFIHTLSFIQLLQIYSRIRNACNNIFLSFLYKIFQHMVYMYIYIYANCKYHGENICHTYIHTYIHMFMYWSLLTNYTSM